MTSLMWDEIHEIPERIERLLAEDAEATGLVARAVRARRPSWATLVARGTSDHAATYGRYLIETELAIPTGLAAPSVTTVYGTRLRWQDGLVIAVSQSGRSPDIVEVVEAARLGGSLTVAITNEPGSPLATTAEHALHLRAGQERSIAATKTYVAELVALATLVSGVTANLALRDGLANLPTVLRATLDATDRWLRPSGLVDEVASSDRALVLSRGFDLATALEVALKLKETSGIFAEAYSVADLEHGPITLAAVDVPTIVFRPDGAMGGLIDAAVDRVTATGARPWIVGGRDGAPGHRTLALPIDLAATLAPAAMVLPGQLLAEAVARVRGRDPDAPVGLSKVTLTR